MVWPASLRNRLGLCSSRYAANEVATCNAPIVAAYRAADGCVPRRNELPRGKPASSYPCGRAMVVYPSKMLETVYVPTSVQNIFLLNTDSVDFGAAARLTFEIGALNTP